MKRVLIVTNSLSGGGAERSMNLVCNELTDRGWTVALVPINTSVADLVTPKCEVFPLDRQWRGSAINTFSAIVKFNLVVRSWKPDTIVLNCDLPEIFGALLLGKYSLVVVEHSSIAWIKRVRVGKIVRRMLSLRHAAWVAVSSHLQIWPDDRTPEAVLQNPLTPALEAKIWRAAGARLERLVFIGRLTSEKRPEQMLEISKHTGLPVQIIGEGYLKESLKSEASSEGLEVTFHGYLQDPWSVVTQNDLLIIPSATEGDGLVAIEGMQRGMPLLLSDIPEFRRFGLPERNYCRAIEDFVTKIKEYGDDLGSLVVPTQTSNSILNLRSLSTVGDAWEKFLTSL